MLYGIDFDQVSHTNNFAPERVIETFPEFVALEAAVTVNVFASTAVSITLSGAKKFVCETWSKSIPYNNRASISATFRQVFEA